MILSRPILLVSLALVITGCNFPGFVSNQSRFTSLATESFVVDENLPPLAIVTFQAQVPPGTPTDQAIFIDILDEVTGLALHVQRHQMQYISENVASIDLPFQVGSIIKYRYSRVGNYPTIEQNSQGEPVRYRLYHVVSPGVIQDIISAWTDLPYVGPTGRIIGKATSIADGSPLPGLLACAGGIQVFTDSNGEFIIEGLPPAIHNLVVYAIDGAYQTFQQGALIAPESTTPAVINLEPSEWTDVRFVVSVPDGTLPAIPIRLAGNLYQLGNTYADHKGGISTIASRMPVLTPEADGTYSIQLSLPIGAYIEYKYTLGDGFWNAEHKLNGEFRLRSFVVPDQQKIVKDEIDTWGENPNAGPVLFDVRVPENTPLDEYVSIQFNPFGWTEPIPMWFLGENHWAYLLISPLTGQGTLSYRYCRNDLCGQADDVATGGDDSIGRVIHISPEPQTIRDQVDGWKWLTDQSLSNPAETEPINISKNIFIAGIELTPYYHPVFKPRFTKAFSEIDEVGANVVILTPSWTFTDADLPNLEIRPNQDPLWHDVQEMITLAQAEGLAVLLFPQPNFQTDSESWWQGTPRDYAWWVSWFERYSNFVIHHADLAERTGAQGIILGGSWLDPALPGGKLRDNSPSNVPADANQRWEDIIAQVRAHFGGEIYWALTATPTGLTLPSFSQEIDRYYLLWSLPLSGSNEENPEQFEETTGNYLDTQVFPYQLTTGKTFLLGISYPSVEGALTGCVPDTLAGVENQCLNFSQLSQPNPDRADVTLNLEEQLIAYKAVVQASLQREWIEGVVARGYYYPALLQDKSTSPNGKPVIELLRQLYTLTKTK